MLNARAPFAATIVAVALLLFLAAPAGASTSSAMVSEMNHVRASYGLRPLRMSDSINRSSYGWASNLIRHSALGHASLRSARVRGEVIEMHSGRSAHIRGALREWLHSPPHRAILLSRSFHVVGVGKASGRWRGMAATIWVARFN